MSAFLRRACTVFLVLCMSLSLLCLPGCGSEQSAGAPAVETAAEEEPDITRFLTAVEDEPDTVDFQCTSIHYTVATNVFNRLVETENNSEGGIEMLPSLAESWEISDDGCAYTFHLRENVRFSNGSALTSSDVLYTFIRLLTHPDSCNRDIAEGIVGARSLEKGETDTLEGFTLLGDYDFTITLEQPFAAFLACLSMPGASILDEETTREAGDRFGVDADWTIGTGSFIIWKWERGKGMVLKANKDCFMGAPRCAGLNLCYLTDAEEVRQLFEQGKLDVLDLDELGNLAEYFIHGDIYQERLLQVPRIGISYIALNESVAPLDDVRVRKALQLSLDRSVLLDAVYSGRGAVENGIFPRGLYGCNPELPEIPYDPEGAKALLAEAGYPEGFELTVSVKNSSTQWEMTLMRVAVSMWERIGVRATIEVLDESEFMRLRKSGSLACYSAAWMADFDDPDNFIYTFFGTSENTRFRSLCYGHEEIMARVRAARAIGDPDERLREYQALEEIIVQEDAAWIPLFSRTRYYVSSERAEGVRATWNGSVKNAYREVTIRTEG